MTTFEAIKSAIENRQPISFTYDGKGERIGNPYAIYVHTNDTTKVHIVQTSGYSEKGELNAFKPFSIEKIENVHTISEADSFVPDHLLYKPDSPYYSKVIVKV